MKSLSLQNVEVLRDGKQLLGPLDFSLTTEGITAILGHNDAFKSLFLHVCHGQFSASKCTIHWNDLPVADTCSCRSLMFQNTPLMCRSVAANVEFPLIALGIPKAERAARVNEALTTVRLSKNPSAPAASLDPASTKELETSVRAVASSGVKVLIATHDLMQARIF